CAVAFVLGIKNLIEPDMWWYLRTGEWIVTNLSVPTADMLSFTFEGGAWYNVKWLYEVLVYFLEHIGGPAFITFWQGCINVCIVIVLWQIFRQLRPQKKDTAGIGWWLAAMLPALFISEFRWTARPESVSHLLALIYLWLMLRHQLRKDKIIWALVPLQVLWANMHEAFATGIILTAIFVFTPTALHYLRTHRLKLPPRHELILFAGVCAGIMLNPRGYLLYAQAIDIFGQLEANKFTNELLSVGHSFYRSQWQAMANGLLFILTAIGLLWLQFKNSLRQIPAFYLIVLMAFAYLALSALRNIPFTALAVAPLTGCLLYELLKKTKLQQWHATLWIPVLAGLYLAVAGNFYYEWSGSRDRFGMDVSGEYHPQGTVNYIRKNNISGPHFSDYLTANYPMWALRPKHKSFIDLRDLDVFPAEFFNDVLLLTKAPQFFDEFDERYNFGYAFIRRADFGALIGYLYRSPRWQLVQADAVSVLFLKTEKTIDADVFAPPSPMEVGSLCTAINTLLWPLYTPVRRLSNTAEMAADFYLLAGDYDKALLRCRDKKNAEFALLRGRTYAAMLPTAQNPDSIYSLALQSLQMAIDADESAEAPRKALALLHLNAGNTIEAVSQFKKLAKENSTDPDVYSYLAYCQNLLQAADPANATGYIKRWFEYMEKAAALAPENPIIRYQLGVSYCDRGDCENAARFIKDLGSQPDLTEADNRRLAECQKLCL
ncbi:MAG: hypothetical protein KDC37_01380, partial [Flavobacteriales bacterium]|nr:hypothetical protein [Flavobacteriales bacterium]